MLPIKSSVRIISTKLAILSVVAVLLFSTACKTGSATGDDTAEIVESGGTSNVDAIREFEAAVQLWEASDGTDLRGVRDRLESALSEDRRFGIAWFNLGVLDEAEGDKGEARKSYEEALKYAPRLGQAHVNLGMLELADGNRDAARQYFEQALEVQPYNAAAHNNMSVLLRDEGHYDEAVSHARRSLAGDSQNTNAYANLARVYLDQGNSRVARLVIFNAMQLESQLAQERLGGGEEAENPEESQAGDEQASADLPNGDWLQDSNPDLYNILGMIELEQNDVTSAIIRFRETLDRDPEYVPALLNLGSIILNVRDYQQALDLFGRVLAQHPEHKVALISSAVAHRGLGDLDKSRELYEQVLAIDPEDAISEFNLGVLEHEHLAQNAQLGIGNEPADPNDPVATMDWTIDNLETSIGHYEKAIEHYRNFLHFERGNYVDQREDANQRISQIREVMEMTREQIPMLREQRDMLATEMRQMEQAAQQPDPEPADDGLEDSPGVDEGSQ